LDETVAQTDRRDGAPRLFAISETLSAQWPPYPTSGVPRTPDGKPNLAAPAPRMATIDDPKAYTQPFTVRVNQRILLDAELIEFVCLENEQSVPHLVGK
jgi:hypothetical protein